MYKRQLNRSSSKRSQPPSTFQRGLLGLVPVDCSEPWYMCTQGWQPDMKSTTSRSSRKMCPGNRTESGIISLLLVASPFSRSWQDTPKNMSFISILSGNLPSGAGYGTQFQFPMMTWITQHDQWNFPANYRRESHRPRQPWCLPTLRHPNKYFVSVSSASLFMLCLSLIHI